MFFNSANALTLARSRAKAVESLIHSGIAGKGPFTQEQSITLVSQVSDAAIEAKATGLLLATGPVLTGLEQFIEWLASHGSLVESIVQIILSLVAQFA